MNKENLQKQIEEMRTKLADMEAELNKPEVNIPYWQPSNKEYYYYVNSLGYTSSSDYAQDFQLDKVRYRVFKTQKEAGKYAEYVKAEETLRRVITEDNEGWLPDWDTYTNIKYVVVLNSGELNIFSYSGTKYLPNFMYIKSRALAEKLMKEYEVEFITYLSY